MPLHSFSIVWHVTSKESTFSTIVDIKQVIISSFWRETILLFFFLLYKLHILQYLQYYLLLGYNTCCYIYYYMSHLIFCMAQILSWTKFYHFHCLNARSHKNMAFVCNNQYNWFFRYFLSFINCRGTNVLC